jgi:hypothetical protein
MSALLCLSLLVGSAEQAPPIGSPGVGTLWSRECQGSWHGQTYHPQEGDLVFFSSQSAFFCLAYTVARTGHPYHVGIVVRNRCGQLCVYESGGNGLFAIAFIPICPRFYRYLDTRWPRRIWIRRIRTPLTPEQSRCLTAFAEAQDGKRFAPICRMGLMTIPGRPLRPTHPDQQRWFCAELVCEMFRTCGLFSVDGLCPEKTAPRDLFTDRRLDLSTGWHAPETWSPDSCPPPPGPLFAPR